MRRTLDGEYRRYEAEQATHICALLALFDAEGDDSAFVFTFANYHLLHRPGPPADLDLDLASYGVVKVLEDPRGAASPDMLWAPKEAFAAVATFYRAAAFS